MGLMRTLFLGVLLSSFIALAGDDLSPEQLGQIEHEQKKADAAIDKKYGNRQSSEMSQDERREMIHEKAEAEQAILDKHGVDKKEYVHATSKSSREDRERSKAAEKAAEKKDAEEAQKKPEQKQIVIEHGLPPEDGVNEAAEMDKQMGYKK